MTIGSLSRRACFVLRDAPWQGLLSMTTVFAIPPLRHAEERREAARLEARNTPAKR
jgi:hypothetical protein